MGSSVIGNAKKTLCIYSADLHLWICKAIHLFCIASSRSFASFLHLLWKNLPVFRVGKWAMFPRNACVACRALLGFESRVCDCLRHLISLDRQHWETSNLPDNQQCIQPAGCLITFHHIFSPSVKINVIQFRLIFSAWRARADDRPVSWSHVDVQSLTSKRGLWFSRHWFLNYLLTIPVWGLKNQVSSTSLWSVFLALIARWMDGKSTDWNPFAFHVASGTLRFHWQFRARKSTFRSQLKLNGSYSEKAAWDKIQSFISPSSPLFPL